MISPDLKTALQRMAKRDGFSLVETSIQPAEARAILAALDANRDADSISAPIAPAKAASSRAVDLTGASVTIRPPASGWFGAGDPRAIGRWRCIAIPTIREDMEEDGFVTVRLGDIVTRPQAERETETGPYRKEPGFLTYEGNIRSGWNSHPHTRGTIYVAKEAAQEAVKYGWVRVANNPTQTNDGPCWMMQR